MLLKSSEEMLGVFKGCNRISFSFCIFLDKSFILYILNNLPKCNFNFFQALLRYNRGF